MAEYRAKSMIILMSHGKRRVHRKGKRLRRFLSVLSG